MKGKTNIWIVLACVSVVFVAIIIGIDTFVPMSTTQQQQVEDQTTDCISSTSPTLRVKAYDALDKDAAAFSMMVQYRTAGSTDAFTVTSTDTDISLNVGENIEVFVNASGEYAAYQASYVIPCSESPTLKLYPYDNSTASSMSQYIVQPDGQVNTERNYTLSAGDKGKCFVEHITATFEDSYGNQLAYQQNPACQNILVIPYNPASYDRVWVTMNGAELPIAPKPDTASVDAGNTSVSYFMPPIVSSSAETVFQVCIDVDDTNNPANGALDQLVMTLYDVGWYMTLNNQVVCGVETESNLDVGIGTEWTDTINTD